MKPTFRWLNKKRHEVIIEQNFLSTLQAFRPDLELYKIKEIILDSDKYFSSYPDVLEAGACAVDHYYNHGEKEGRVFYAPKISERHVASQLTEGKKVYISDMQPDNGIFLYRVLFRMVNEPESLNVPYHSKITDLVAAIFSAREVVFIRPVHSEKNIYLYTLCYYLNVKITFDIDDLMLPEYVDEKGGIRSGLANYNTLRTDLVLNSAALIRADELTCTTQKIADTYKSSIKKYTIIKNKLPKSYFNNARRSDKNANIKAELKLKILYLSGTATHLKDYSIISGVLTKLAQKHPGKFEINFMGQLKDQSLLFRSLNIASTHIRYEHFQKMLDIIGEHHVVLVPLENSEFNNAKSNIKFIEAASQGVPVIASTATEFVNTIEDDNDGWLCSNEQEWYDRLAYLIANPERTFETGMKAYHNALANFSL
ncbi:glycosyltransferase [Erwinia sp. DT-104]|uniref:glycosyltransferase n=1 Tax=Erwinia sp. DT-104 TaxID=3396161 RepID=UPI003F1A46F7